MIALWMIMLALPIGTALLFCMDEPTRIFARRFVPWVSVPPVAMAIFWPAEQFAEASWFMFGGAFGLDSSGQFFMLLTSVAWAIASFYARRYTADDPKKDRFWLSFLLTMVGNLGLVGAFSIGSFYLFFALMTFSAFGLVVHDETTTAHFAARVYITMAILGEALLLVGLVMAGQAAPDWDLRTLGAEVAHDPRVHVITGLLLTGFGIKAGAVLLHMWLPLAHPAAPTPASAVLSGAMIKAGLIGWMRFLPGGEIDMTIWAGFMIVMGLIAAFFGVVVGLVQTNPKANLAYSSISQMGYMTLAIGMGLMEPALRPVVLTAAAIYALHHGLAKSTLFLGVGVAQSAIETGRQRTVLLIGLAFASVTLAGAPLTSGYLAKLQLKELASELSVGWYRAIDVILPIAAIGTLCLLARFLWLIFRATRSLTEATAVKRGLWRPWLVSLVCVVLLPWIALWWFGHAAPEKIGSLNNLWKAGWPILAGLGIIMLVWWRGWRYSRSWKILPGDILVPINRVVALGISAWSDLVVPTSARLQNAMTRCRNMAILKVGRWMAAGEVVLTRWGTGGAMFLMLILLLVLVLTLTGR